MTVPSPIPIILLTNGRPDCVAKAIPSVGEHLLGVGDGLIVDDSGDDVYRGWLAEEFGAPVVPVGDGPCGYWRAMQTVWAVAAQMESDHWMLVEEDFIFKRDVDVRALADVLDAQALQQIVLLRQPWFANELQRGGVIEAREAEGGTFEERTDGTHYWIEHRDHWSMNPTILRVELCRRHPWPSGAWSESRFGRSLLSDPSAKFAYWGRRSDQPLVEHIGAKRVGRDY